MTATNLWEADQLRKLTTVAAVDAQIDRCIRGQAAAPTDAKMREWGKKLAFLARLKEHVAMKGAPCSAFMRWFNQSPWAGAGKDAGEIAQSAWNAAIHQSSEVYWRHEITIRKTGIGDSQILVAAIKNLAAQ